MEVMLGISVYRSLSLLAITLCLSYYFLCLLFNKIGEKGRTGLPGSKGDGGINRVGGQGGRNDQNNVCTYEYMN
jgi:hypothetical protein